MFLNNAAIANTNNRLFGYFPNELTPQPYNFRGMEGWFAVPRGWSVQCVNGQYQASPNEDFSTPLYMCEVNDDGTLVFQDMKMGTSKRSIFRNGIPSPNW